MASRSDSTLNNDTDSWDAELTAITLLPPPTSLPHRVIVEPVSMQVDEPLDRIRPIAEGMGVYAPSSAFKTVL